MGVYDQSELHSKSNGEQLIRILDQIIVQNQNLAGSEWTSLNIVKQLANAVYVFVYCCIPMPYVILVQHSLTGI